MFSVVVGRMVHAIKMGWMKLDTPKPKPEDLHQYYLMWDADDKSEEVRRLENPIRAPKPRLPGHAESYNPPPEYTFTKEETEKWMNLKDTPYKRKFPFIPKQHSSLLSVPAYDRFARERFVRCLDLYLCPRTKRMRLTIQPEDLVPQLPKPRDLQPFPTVCSLVFKGHTSLVRTISHDPSGQFLASGSDDNTVKGRLSCDQQNVNFICYYQFSLFSQCGKFKLVVVSRLSTCKESSVLWHGVQMHL